MRRTTCGESKQCGIFTFIKYVAIFPDVNRNKMLEVTVKTLDGKNRSFCVPDDVGYFLVYGFKDEWLSLPDVSHLIVAYFTSR